MADSDELPSEEELEDVRLALRINTNELLA